MTKNYRFTQIIDLSLTNWQNHIFMGSIINDLRKNNRIKAWRIFSLSQNNFCFFPFLEKISEKTEICENRNIHKIFMKTDIFSNLLCKTGPFS